MVGAINLHKGLSPSSQRPCWAHTKKHSAHTECFFLAKSFLQIRAVVPGDQRDLIAAVQAAQDILWWMKATAARPTANDQIQWGRPTPGYG